MKKNIVFMGTPKFSADILKDLALNHNVKLVLTQTDKVVGRKKILTPPEVKIMANELNIEVLQPKTLKNNEDIKEKIISQNPDFIIVAAYGKILPKTILDICPCINTHASLLPKYRGASPIQGAILANEKISGITLMNMDIGLDTGDILYQKTIEIYGKTAQKVFDEMSKLSSKMLLEFLQNPDGFKPIKQDESKATLTGIIKKEDGLVDFLDAKKMYLKYLAYTPWPGIFLQNGIKILELELIDENIKNEKNGVIKKVENDGFVLGCSIGDIKIRTIQNIGKKPIGGKEFLNGKRLRVGDRFEI